MTDTLTESIIGYAIEVHRVPEVATAQVLSCLKATKLQRALLLNFGDARIARGINRISL